MNDAIEVLAPTDAEVEAAALDIWNIANGWRPPDAPPWSLCIRQARVALLAAARVRSASPTQPAEPVKVRDVEAVVTRLLDMEQVVDPAMRREAAIALTTVFAHYRSAILPPSDHIADASNKVGSDAPTSAENAPVAKGDDAPVMTAVHYAQMLAATLHSKHFPAMVDWKPLPDLLGLLTQIDNMTVGLVRHEALPAGEDGVREYADAVARARETLTNAEATGTNPTTQRALEYRLGELINKFSALTASPRSAAVEDGWSRALSAAADVAYRVCAETRHVTLGENAAAAIRALVDRPKP